MPAFHHDSMCKLSRSSWNTHKGNSISCIHNLNYRPHSFKIASCYCLTPKSNYLADGRQLRTKPISTTTLIKSSRSHAASRTHQNTPHKTPSTSFGGHRSVWESPGGAAAAAVASAPPRRHLCFMLRLLFRFGFCFRSSAENVCIWLNKAHTGKSESTSWLYNESRPATHQKVIDSTNKLLMEANFFWCVEDLPTAEITTTKITAKITAKIST